MATAQKWCSSSLFVYQINIFVFNIFKKIRCGYTSVRSVNGLSTSIKRIFLTSISALLLASCTTQGDFGRDRPSVYKDNILPFIRNFVTLSNGKPISRFPLTGRERRLRSYRHRISHDMSYPTVESYYLSTIASMGLIREPLPRLGEEIRFHGNARKPVVDVSENARINPYALASEIEDDIILIRNARRLTRLIRADDRLRLKRLAAMRGARQSDRDDVSVRVQENLRQIKYIQHVAKLRVTHYKRVIDLMSISDPAKNLGPVRAQVKNFEIEVNNFIGQPPRRKNPNPGMLLDKAYGQEL